MPVYPTKLTTKSSMRSTSLISARVSTLILWRVGSCQSPQIVSTLMWELETASLFVFRGRKQLQVTVRMTAKSQARKSLRSAKPSIPNHPLMQLTRSTRLLLYAMTHPSRPKETLAGGSPRNWSATLTTSRSHLRKDSTSLI